MARGMCCVVLSMYEPSADSSSMGSLSHMADHMTLPRRPVRMWPDAGGQKKQTTHLDSQTPPSVGTVTPIHLRNSTQSVGNGYFIEWKHLISTGAALGMVLPTLALLVSSSKASSC